MGIKTKLNSEIKKLIISPFWNPVSSDNKDKLYFHLVDKINFFVNEKNKQRVPDKFLIGINRKIYKKIVKNNDNLLLCLEKKINEYFKSIELEAAQEVISLDFLPLSCLKDNEIKLICNYSEKSKNWKYYIKLINEDSGKWIIEQPGEYKIGRNINAFININNPYVSEFHARLVLSESGKIKISDCGSRNGIYLNDDFRRIKGDTYIIPGDKIYLGKRRQISLVLLDGQ